MNFKPEEPAAVVVIITNGKEEARAVEMAVRRRHRPSAFDAAALLLLLLLQAGGFVVIASGHQSRGRARSRPSQVGSQRPKTAGRAEEAPTALFVFFFFLDRRLGAQLGTQLTLASALQKRLNRVTL